MALLLMIGIVAVRGRQAGSIGVSDPRSADAVSCRDNVLVPDQQTIRTGDERGNCCSAFESRTGAKEISRLTCEVRCPGISRLV